MINKKTILVVIISIIAIIILFLLNSMINNSKKEIVLDPNSGGNEAMLKVKDEQLYLYKNMTTPSDYDGFKNNLALFVAKKNGKTNDTVSVVGVSERVAREPYPRYFDVNIPSLNKTYKVKVDYNQDRSKLLFIIEDENFVSDLNIQRPTGQ